MAAEQKSILSTQALIRDIVRTLVDDESAVQVSVEPFDVQTVFRLQVAPGDVGKLIGKHGHTARSLRTILGIIGKSRGIRYGLDIVQPERD